MGRVGRQRLYTGLSTLLDLIAIGLFFVQSLVGDADWIKEEFTEYQFWTSVSDLGLLNVLKALLLILIYCIIGISALTPAVIISATVNFASLVKMIVFIVHAARTKTRLPGLHFVLPIYICAVCWIQVMLSRFGRHADHRLLFEDADNEIASMGDYTSIQATHDYRATLSPHPRKTTPIAPSQKRRRYGRETEPLLPADSLSKSVSIAVIPSVPEEPTLRAFASTAGIGFDGSINGDRASSNTSPTTLTSLPPPTAQFASLMQSSLPTKSYIRALKQIPNSFTLRDVSAWLKSTFPNVVDLEDSAARDIVLTFLDTREIIAATPISSSPSEIELDNALFIFPGLTFKSSL